ncbi:hypothetical protein ACS0TY_010250 [Phlomoides rotata]
MVPRMVTLGALVGLGRAILYRPRYSALRNMSSPDLLTGQSLIMNSILPFFSIDSIIPLTCFMLMIFLFFARPVEGMLIASNAFLKVMLVYLGRLSILISQGRTLANTGAPKAAQLRGTADRIIGKFASWKGSSLSLASRVCLVNSIIISSLVHSMMIYKWPRSLLNKIEKVMRNFIWTGSIEEKGFCMVNGSKVCAPREEDAQNSVHYIFRLEGYS